jgi:hypothetical protein
VIKVGGFLGVLQFHDITEILLKVALNTIPPLPLLLLKKKTFH